MTKPCWPAFVGLGFLCLTSLSVIAEETLETIEVTGSTLGQTINDLGVIKEKLDAVPGGTNLIDTQNKPSIVTLTDALGNQPGIIVQEFFGGLDQPRLNIRGSGLQANPVSRGVLIRENNLPINEADGSFIMGTLDIKNAEAIAIHRGANSRVPGTMTLGGDINFINDVSGGSKSKIQVESGSFGQQAFLFNHQQQHDALTYQIGFSDESAEGYRNHSSSSKTNYLLSTSQRLTPNLINQTHIRNTELHFDMPFVLTQQRAASDPTSVYGDGGEIFDIGLNMYKRDPHRTVKQTRFTNQTQFTFKHAEHYLGVYYQNTDDAFVDPMSHIETDSTLSGLHYTFDHYPTNYFHYQLGIDYNNSDMPRRYYGNHPFNGNRIASYASFDLEASNLTGSAHLNLTLFPEWIVNGQLQYTQSNRSGTKQEDNTSLDYKRNLATPKLGLIYQPALLDLKLFANISESKEIPTYWEYIGTSLNPLFTELSQAFFQELEPQEAITFELGGKYETEYSVWDITAYRSEIDKELMSTASQYGVIANTVNYQGTTIHQGIEAGLSGAIPLRFNQLVYQLTWNYSDFYFDDGIFEGNQIAGVPDHIISGELLYKSDNFMIGPSFYWVPTDNPVDHENTVDNEGYTLFGLKGSANINQLFSIFMRLDNITDQTYNSTYVIRENSNPNLPTFLPGNGFSAQLGFKLGFPG